MTKRIAPSQLNHENWNEEEPKEEAGTFKVASKVELSKRVMKKAKRSVEDARSPNVFSGFTGFGSPAVASKDKVSFDFLNPSAAKAQPTSVNSSTTNGGGFSFKLSTETSASNVGSPFTVSSSTAPAQDAFSAADKESGLFKRDADNKARSEYLLQLRSLNECVLSWIQEHVKKTPFCVLTPVFNDYKNHLKEISKKFPSVSDKSTRTKTSAEIGTTLEKNEMPVTIKDNSDQKKISENLSQTRTTSFTDNVRAVLNSERLSEQTNEDDEYRPPANDVQEVKEDDAFYSKRCKLFYKKDKSYVEKGVGTLHLKTKEDKTQLVIRADTNLGLILLNIYLTPDVPASRIGKKDVTLTCIPYPPLDPKNPSSEPATFLVRVKSEDDANELFTKISDIKS